MPNDRDSSSPLLQDWPIVIAPRVAEQMRDHALAAYPGECCGLLFASAGTEHVVRLAPMDNLQDRLHALDPESYPRTSRNGFQMNALLVHREIEGAAARGERLLAFFHSHIDCDAAFSQEDRDMAAPPPDRLPVYPGVWHVIVACWPDGVREARAFLWNGSDFEGHVLRAFPGGTGTDTRI